MFSEGRGGSGRESHGLIDVSVAGVICGEPSTLKMNGESLLFPSTSVNEPAIESSSISELLNASSQSLAILLLKWRSSSVNKEAALLELAGAPCAFGWLPSGIIGRSGDGDRNTCCNCAEVSITLASGLFRFTKPVAGVTELDRFRTWLKSTPLLCLRPGPRDCGVPCLLLRSDVIEPRDEAGRPEFDSLDAFGCVRLPIDTLRTRVVGDM